MKAGTLQYGVTNLSYQLPSSRNRVHTHGAASVEKRNARTRYLVLASVDTRYTCCSSWTLLPILPVVAVAAAVLAVIGKVLIKSFGMIGDGLGRIGACRKIRFSLGFCDKLVQRGAQQVQRNGRFVRM